MSLEDIKKMYGGTIDASVRGQAALDNLQRVTEVMARWNPLFSTRGDIVDIMGTPTRTTDDALEYTFDAGRAAAEWRFRLSGNRVVGVEFIPGE